MPRLHVLAGRRYSPWAPEADGVGGAAPGALRAELLRVLAAALGGDALAAEYVLLQLLSRVHARHDPVVLGRHALNLTRCAAGPDGAPSPVATALRDAFAALTPQSRLVGLTLDFLNDGDLVPRKDYDINRMLPGFLQMAEGTAVVVDETALAAGKLEESGVRNFGRLKAAVAEQRYDADFKFYQMPMPCDLPVTVVSEGRTVLHADTHVPLQATAAASRDLLAGMAEPERRALRAYLARARALEHAIDAEVSERVQADLVRRRQADASLTEADFNRWLTLARLLAASKGEASLTWATWGEVHELERRREARVRVC